MSNSLFPQAENNYYELCCALFWWLQGFDGNVWLFTFTISLYLSLKTSINTPLPIASTQLLQISLATFPWRQSLLPKVLHWIKIRWIWRPFEYNELYVMFKNRIWDYLTLWHGFTITTITNSMNLGYKAGLIHGFMWGFFSVFFLVSPCKL